MKKNNIFNTIFMLSIIITIFVLNITHVYAVDYGRISTTTGLIMRKGAGTSYSKIVTIPHNTIVTINEQNITTSDSSTGCTTGKWHKVTYNDKTGYVCTAFVELTGNSSSGIEIPETDMSKMTEEEYDAYLNSQKFPESYKVKLKELHKKHPNWVFVGISARDTWANVLKNENVSGRSLYQSTSSSTQGYLHTGDGYYNWYTDKFDAKDGSTWYQANSQTVQYYMDPRNFLNDDGIFMFEDLNFYSSYQTSNAVQAILNTDFYKDLIQYYMEAAATYNVSPIYLAALSRQEVGLSSGYATSGNAGSYCGTTSVNGHYNFYNIQATAGKKPACNGLNYAVQKGWNTKQKAIVGGASWIVSGYINAGQNTPYFQKWNTSKNATKPYYHQYMANIRAVSSSATTTKNSYNSMGILEYPFVFQIPIYNGIPETTSLPQTGNPNNWLKTLKVNNTSVTNFDAAETKYTVNVPAGTKSVSIAATTINSNAKTHGTGTISLTENTTKADIVVTAQNGNVRTYTITIIRLEEITPPNNEDNNNETDKPEDNNENNNNNENNQEPDKDENEITPTAPTINETITSAGYTINNNYLNNFTLGSTVQGTITKLQTANKYASINITDKNNEAKTSGSIVTGDKITIESNNEAKTYTVVIYGDNNGDGEITTLDLLLVQKHLLKKSTLTNAFLKASDVNKDGNVTTLDLLLVQKHLLKKSNISQK